MPDEPYKLNYTACALLPHASAELLRLYAQTHDWAAVRTQALADNIFQVRARQSMERYCSELTGRFKTLSPAELAFAADCTDRERGYVLWTAVCRRYAFIADMALELLHERFGRFRTDLCPADYDEWYARTAQWRPEMTAVKPDTYQKIRSRIFTSLREAELLGVDGQLQPPLVSPRLAELWRTNNGRDALNFPVLDSMWRTVNDP